MFAVVHVFAVVAATLHGRPESLEVPGVVRRGRFPGQHPDPLGGQDVWGDTVMPEPQAS